MFNSERLHFREMVPNDRSSLQTLFSDPVVMRFSEGTKTKQETEKWINQSMNDYRSFGVGYWIIEKRETGQFVGQCGLRPQKIQGEVRMGFGYLLTRTFWGMGYGKEAAQACRTFSFEHLGLSTLTSLIHPYNLPSIKIAKSLGMKKEGTICKHHQWLEMYVLHNRHETFIN
ncbi:RimJ/RimL family protein N-acetyltransferase [Geomicrobium halophilum]|uniref:RimJ/RimL family protein N-acetyltransferase n=1 Tax=Geomicrobium halophilum TaxID=549000 RepID=A0A841PP97_9BACL|nr:GNAT family N-acetyltransferase [Geomicrobium halophilum]MBB6450657.1 RimJ/RimL family protein N-acetyltransferase [Geomicrobium halophilum]